MSNFKAPKNWEFILAVFIIAYFFLIQFFDQESIDSAKLKEYLTVLPHNRYINPSLDYSKFAYVQYATSLVFLNLAILNFINIRESSSKVGNLVIVHADTLGENENDGSWAQLEKLKKLASEYGIKLKPVPLITNPGSKDSDWQFSFTKFHVFNQLEYKRIVYFDADSMLVNVESNDGQLVNLGPSHFDELFSIHEDIDFALPQAYWLHDTEKKYGSKKTQSRGGNSLHLASHKFDNRLRFFANHVMVIKPDAKVFRDLIDYIYNPLSWNFFKRDSLYKASEYDMEVLNKYFDDTLRGQVKGKSGSDLKKFGIISHKVYGVLTGEFKEKKHSSFVAEPQDLPFVRNDELREEWDAIDVITNARLVHFSDAPIPKPWEFKLDNAEYYNAVRIYCEKDLDIAKFNTEFPNHMYQPRLTSDCDSVLVWEWLRKEFERRREGNWEVEMTRRAK
ncbi:glucose N-acetyltransferase 1 [[Candida] railenensis]|uniref:Glucose N-acetyltransferase 1 n=1 Tax=[Candida] railenensis TaxID=45579 RepID=A0A9P0QND3_9ASCO|nr:glucose N-acetyltransferase 1 [[Candida] railenensis]